MTVARRSPLICGRIDPPARRSTPVATDVAAAQRHADGRDHQTLAITGSRQRPAASTAPAFC
jgi:hypothetical protein